MNLTNSTQPLKESTEGINLQQNQVLTVSELTTKVKTCLENTIGEAWVKGEISNFKPSASGHYYFNLKDAGAVLSCAIFRGSAVKKGFEVKDGMDVVVHGKISVYPPRGSYQLIVDFINPVGVGALQLEFEKLKTALKKEGLFDPARKRSIPPYPSKIAIITSPTGAALQDMLNVLGRRNSGISILVVPSLVQGTDAPPQIIDAIRVVNENNLAEVIVLARGGGSLEDLWCFNDEMVIRATAASRIPVISAIGHEVDFTLCDFAADLRAPTPSAAAELVSKNKLELLENLEATQKKLQLLLSTKLAKLHSQLLSSENKLISPTERLLRSKQRLDELELRLLHAIESKFPIYRQILDECYSRLSRSAERLLVDKKNRLEVCSNRLEALSPLKVLGRGYTLIEDTQSNALVKSVKQAQSKKEVRLVFHDGKVQATIHSETRT